MKKTLLMLAVMATFPALAIEQPVIDLAQTESKAQSKLYDAELIEVHTMPDGDCFRFDAISIFDQDKTKPLFGKICGDQITFD